ncbi:hypothetical protein [Bradyrhizobium sp. 613_E4_N2_2]|uniref:hypothetical protein n=1 Tax=Bradyrhizobium sp. 613_E4_N2_2 TaxID=3240371 RepID=UPI003F8B3D57
MTVKIATVRTFEEAADAVIRVFLASNNPKLLRFEGFDGVGKSGLARLVASRIGAEHVDFDNFAFRPETPTPYPGCLRRAELDAAINTALASGKPVALDAVCLDDVAPMTTWGRGLVTYVRRLSFNNQYHPLWHNGFAIEDEPPKDEPHRGIVLYHKKAKPHERADLIIELPEEGHTISNFAFNRDHLSDPPGAEVISAGAG